jgi:uncharacterized membrane protein
MKNFGILLVVLGAAFAIYAIFIFDVSVKVNYPGGNSFGLASKVNNIALMEQRQNYIYGSIILILLGFGLTFFDLLKKRDASEEKTEQIKAEKITVKWVLTTIGWIVLFSSIFLVLFYYYVQYWSA